MAKVLGEIVNIHLEGKWKEKKKPASTCGN